MNVVSNECGVKCMLSRLNVVPNENISNEKDSCECGLRWTGLKRTWSQM